MLANWLLILAPAVAAAQTGTPTEKGRVAVSLSEFRTAALAARGNADRGRRLFENAAGTHCVSCHAVGGRGATLGPDLSGLGGGRASSAEILDAILEPSAKIHPDYTSTVVALKSGRVLQGLLRPVSDTEVEVRGFVSVHDEIPISEEARAALRPGKNLLAVHCHQTGGGQYIDVGIIQHPSRVQPSR
jgi:putative heme-binding domain-containing protein